MGNEYSMIAYYIIEIFAIYTVYRIMRIFHEEPIFGKKVEIGSYILCYIAGIIFYQFLNIPIVLFIGNIVLLLLVTVNYDSDIKKKILSVLFINMLMLCVDAFIAILAQYPYLSPIMKGGNAPLFCNVCSKIIQFIVMLVMSKCTSIKKRTELPGFYWFCLIIIPMSSIYMAVNLPINDMTLNQSTMFIAIILFINFSFFYIYDLVSIQAEEKAARMLLQLENNNILKQMEVYKYNLKNMDRARHDLNSHVMVLKSYIEEDQKEKAMEHLDEGLLNLFCDKKQINSGVTIVDSILNLKIQEAETCGIELTVRIAIPYELVLDSFDMIIVLQGLLDYALQETKRLESEKQKVSVHVRFKYLRGRFIIQIWIPYEEGVTSNPDITDIARTIAKYDGFINTETENKKLKVSAVLYLNMEPYE